MTDAPKVAWRRTTHTYDVQVLHVDQYKRRRWLHYTVRRTTSTHSPGESWQVEGGGNMRRHVCDEDGATHKRVVAIVKAALSEPTAQPVTYWRDQPAVNEALTKLK